MQRLLHDAYDFGVLPALDPDDARRVEAEADEARQITIGLASSPQDISFLGLRNHGGCRCGKRGDRGRQFRLEPIGSELVKRAKLQAALRKRRVQPPIGERQEAAVFGCFQMMALKGANVHP